MPWSTFFTYTVQFLIAALVLGVVLFVGSAIRAAVREAKQEHSDPEPFSTKSYIKKP